MRTFVGCATLIGFCGLAGSALADIPTIDAVQLTQHSTTAGATVKLVPITSQRQDTHNGVKCAVTTGKKANVTDPTVQPQAGAGSQAIQSYAPNMPATPGAQGATLSSQTLFNSTGNVVAGLDASRSTLGAAQSAFTSAGQQVGTAPTVMGAFDMNSGARLQNNLAWNGAIGSANLWVTALNALNLAMTSDMSRAAIGMNSGVSPSTSTARVCPVGMTGSGTAADPCRAPTSCSTTPPGSPADPACVAARYVDSAGNIFFYLVGIRAQATQAQALPLTVNVLNPAPAQALSVADVAAALASVRSNAP
jgi:hypothetical protein